MSTFFARNLFTLPRRLLLLLGLLALAGCGGGDAREIELAPLSQMPDFVQTAPANVQEAYRFAVANPELIDQMPCYCGCGGVGHTSNLDCYVKGFNPDGSVAEFDNHAALWTICVDITRDVIRMWREGEELADIRTYIDNEYSRFGPPTDTEPVESSRR